MSDVRYHLSYVKKKGNSKSQYGPLVRCHVRCHMSGGRCQVPGVTCHITGVKCHLSGVMCHLWYVRNVRKGNSKSHHCTLVRCHVSLVRCQMSLVMYHVSHIRCQVSNAICKVSPVRCHMSHVSCEMSEKALAGDTDLEQEPVVPSNWEIWSE